eukprot:4504942-Alexandrium_andersonii.AAC.1
MLRRRPGCRAPIADSGPMSARRCRSGRHPQSGFGDPRVRTRLAPCRNSPLFLDGRSTRPSVAHCAGQELSLIHI